MLHPSQLCYVRHRGAWRPAFVVDTRGTDVRPDLVKVRLSERKTAWYHRDEISLVEPPGTRHA